MFLYRRGESLPRLRSALLMLIAMLFALCVSPVLGAQFFVAKGDEASVVVQNPYGTCWYFPASDGLDTWRFYDIPSIEDVNGTTYCHITSQMSYAMTGEYTLVYTSPIVKDNKTVLKDISWNGKSIVSVFADVKSNTPDGGGNEALAMLVSMVGEHKIDTTQQFTLSVDDPYIHVKTLYGVNQYVVRASGSSNFQDGTEVRIVVDEQDHIATHDVSNFTFKTTVSRPYTEIEGKWEAQMIMPMQEMAPGWHQVTIYSNDLITTARFPLYETSWTPYPTPTQYIKYFGNGSIQPDVVTVERTVIVTKEVDRWHTATPTPPVTDALGDIVEYPFNPEKAASIPKEVILGAGIVVAALVVVRDWKWK